MDLFGYYYGINCKYTRRKQHGRHNANQDDVNLFNDDAVGACRDIGARINFWITRKWDDESIALLLVHYGNVT